MSGPDKKPIPQKRAQRLSNAAATLRNLQNTIGLLDNNDRVSRAVRKVADAESDPSEFNVHAATSAVETIGHGTTSLGIINISQGGKAVKFRADYMESISDDRDERMEIAQKWLGDNHSRQRGWQAALIRHLAKHFNKSFNTMKAWVRRKVDKGFLL